MQIVFAKMTKKEILSVCFWVVILLLMVLLLNGCATTHTSIEERVGFYQANYNDCSDNEKALMLVETLKADGVGVKVLEKVNVVYVYDAVGRRIWPTDGTAVPPPTH